MDGVEKQLLQILHPSQNTSRLVRIHSQQLIRGPGKKNFTKGSGHYFFIITAQSLDSYSIEIRVPTRYIGKY